jgi:hypothetical protein
MFARKCQLESTALKDERRLTRQYGMSCWEKTVWTARVVMRAAVRRAIVMILLWEAVLVL